MPGVVAVYTWEDFNGITGPGYHAMLGEELVVPPPLAITDVRYVGDPVAIVIAESRYLAEDACEADRGRLRAAATGRRLHGRPPPTPRTSCTRAGGSSRTRWRRCRSRPSPPTSTTCSPTAAHVVECDVEQNRYVAMPMETRGIVASYHKGRDELDIVCATQSVHETRNFFARYVQIPEGNVHVTARDVGGGFGQKMFVYREECAVALASYLLGRPVKWIEDRRENLLSAGHSRNEFAHVRMAVDDDGIIQAITADHEADVGAYAVCPAAIDPMLRARAVQDPALRLRAWRWCGPTPWARRPTAGRGCSRPPRARSRSTTSPHEIGLDPAEFRRRNLLAASRPPVHRADRQRVPGDHAAGDARAGARDPRLRGVPQGAGRRRAPRAGTSASGICSYVEPTSMGSNTLATEAATVKVETSGRVVAYLGTTVARPEHRDHHGADRRRAPRRRVRRRHHRAGRFAVDALRTRHRREPHRGRRRRRGARGDRRGAREGAERRRAHDGSRARRPRDRRGRRVGARDAVEVGDDARRRQAGDPRRATSCPDEIGSGLEATVRFRPTQFPTWSNATHICVVEVDGETVAAPRCMRYIVSEDCGRMINPMVVEGQIFGGVVQGMGGVLLEDFVYDDDGNPLTTTFMDYLPPTTTEVPEIEVGHIETESTTNPGGYKGMGEGGAIGAHAAVANAVADALRPLGVKATKHAARPRADLRAGRSRQGGLSPAQSWEGRARARRWCCAGSRRYLHRRGRPDGPLTQPMGGASMSTTAAEMAPIVPPPT